MNREAVFLEELEAELRRQLEEPVMLRIHRIPRNNGGESLCLTILPPGRRSSPAVPLEPYFFRWSQGQSPGELVRELLGEWRRADRGRELEKLAFGDYQQVKGRIYRMAVNREKNRRLLEGQPWRPFLDWALVCYYRLDQRLIPEATVRIDRSHLKLWGITEEELFRQAMENSRRDLPPQLFSMGDLLGVGEEEPPLYVLTNGNRYLGAESITRREALEKIQEKLPGDFYVLPSSIHECLILPDSGQFSKETLNRLVQEINRTQVESAEVLSDQVYLYRRDLNKLCL